MSSSTTLHAARTDSDKTLCGRDVTRVTSNLERPHATVTCTSCNRVAGAMSKNSDDQPTLSFTCSDCHSQFDAEDLLERHDCGARPNAARHIAHLVERLRNPQEFTPKNRSWDQTRDDRIELDRVDTLQCIIDAATVEQHRIVTELRRVRSPDRRWNREARATWEQIGEAIGINKQLATYRFSKPPKVDPSRSSKEV